MEGIINNESSGDGSESGDPAAVAMRKDGEARRAARAVVDPQAWLTGGTDGSSSGAAGGSPARKRGAGNQDAPGSGCSQGSALNS